LVVPAGRVSKNVCSVMACGGKWSTRYAGPPPVFFNRGGLPDFTVRLCSSMRRATRSSGRTTACPGRPASKKLPIGSREKTGKWGSTMAGTFVTRVDPARADLAVLVSATSADSTALMRTDRRTTAAGVLLRPAVFFLAELRDALFRCFLTAMGILGECVWNLS